MQQALDQSPDFFAVSTFVRLAQFCVQGRQLSAAPRGCVLAVLGESRSPNLFLESRELDLKCIDHSFFPSKLCCSAVIPRHCDPVSRARSGEGTRKPPANAPAFTLERIPSTCFIMQIALYCHANCIGPTPVDCLLAFIGQPARNARNTQVTRKEPASSAMTPGLFIRPAARGWRGRQRNSVRRFLLALNPWEGQFSRR
jgi:hypothetical protein